MDSQSASIIVLSGGTSSRFGRDKALAILGTQTIIEYVLSNIPKEFEIIIVGQDPRVSGVNYKCTQEKPSSGGPVAAIASALELCTSNVVGVLAMDMPFALPHMLDLLKVMSPSDGAVMYVDSKAYKQPLAAIYQCTELEKAISLLPQINGASMRELISLMTVREILMSPDVEKSYIDVDTAHDLSIAVEYLRKL